MRDYYDVYILWKLRKKEIDKSLLKTALTNTSKHRKTYDQIFSDYFAIMSSIEQDPIMMKLWETYQTSYPFAKEVTWEDSIISIGSMMIDIMS